MDEAEADEMWSFVQNKGNQRWFWHAISHETGEVLAYVIGTHHDKALLELKNLLKPFGIEHFFTDGGVGMSDIYRQDIFQLEKKKLKK